MRRLIWLCATSALASAPSLVFEANQGQADVQVRYVARSNHAAYAFTATGITSSLSSHRIDWTFPGGLPARGWQPQALSERKVHSFVGTPDRWRRDIDTFERLRWDGLYRHIDLVAYAEGPRLEFDFVIHPGGDPRQIRLRFTGSRRLSLDAAGALILETAVGEMRHLPPVTYQINAQGKREPIASRFRLLNHQEAAFAVGDYDPRRDLVIDPVVRALTYVGGEGDDEIAATSGGVICGSYASADFLQGRTEPALERSPERGAPSRDVFVQVASSVTYFGGSDEDRPTACTQSGGGVVVAGVTRSRDFPVGAWQGGSLTPRPGLRLRYGDGDAEGFLVYFPLFSNSGNWTATYWGSAGERITALAASGFPFVIGVATQTSDPQLGVGSRITLLSQSLAEQSLARVDGKGDDRVDRLAFDSDELVAAGVTNSPDLINAPAQARDAFLMRYAIANLEIREERLFGGSGDESVHALAVVGGFIWLGGSTTSPDLPLNQPWQTRVAGGADGFAAAFLQTSLELRRSSYHGGPGEDVITAIQPNPHETWLAGTTSSSGLPVARDADQPRFAGGKTDGFYLTVPLAGQPLSVASYLGGAGDDEILGLTAAPQAIGNTTAALDLPTIPARSFRAGREGFQATLQSRPIPGIVLGRGLTAFFQTPNNRTVSTLRSSDPTRLLLSDRGGPDLKAVAVSEFGEGIALHGQAAEGDVELIINTVGLAEQRVPVRLVPTGFVLRQGSGRVNLSWFLGPSDIFPAALDPDTGHVLAQQQLSLAAVQTAPVPTVESSNPSVIEVGPTGEVRAVALGNASLRVRQPAGFRDTAPVELAVGRFRVAFTCPEFGQNLRTIGTVTNEGSTRIPITVSIEEGPVRLTYDATNLSTTNSSTISGGPLWFETIGNSGTATIRMSGDGVEPARFDCPVYPSEFVFSGRSANLPPLDLSVGQRSLLSVVPRLAGRQESGAPQYLSPAGGNLPIRVESSGAAMEIAPATFAAGAQRAEVAITPRGEGRSRLILVSPGGLDAGARSIEINALPPAPIRPQGSIVVGRFLTYRLTFVPSGSGTNTRITARVRGGLLLRSERDLEAGPELSATFQNGFGTLLLDALGETGVASLVIDWETESGSGQFTLPVEIVPSRLGWGSFAPDDLVTTPRSGPVGLSAAGYLEANGLQIQQPLSPGFASQVRVAVSPAALAEFVPPFSVQPLAAGLADLTLESVLPILPGQGRLRLRIVPARATLAPVIVGAHLVASASLSIESRQIERPLPPARIRLTSSAPNVLRLAPSQGVLGQESIEISPTQAQTNYFVHGISTGNATITAEFVGGESTTLPVVVLPTAVRFANVSSPLMAEFSAGQTSVGVQIVPLDPIRLVPFTESFSQVSQTLRPGLETLLVDLVVEPAGIVTPNPARLSFSPGSTSASLVLRHVAPGRTQVSIVQPPGFTTPAVGLASLTVELNATRLIFSNPPLLGRDTLSSISLNTSENRSSPQPVTLTSSDPARLLLSTSSTQVGAAQITLSPNTGSQIFLHGLASSGTATVTAQAPGLMPATQTITFSETTIALSLPGRVNLGQTFTLTASPTVSSNFNVSVRPGANVPITLRATPAGILEIPAQVQLGQPFSVKALAVGTVSLEVLPPAGFAAGPPSAPITVALAELQVPTSIQLGKDLLSSFNFFAGAFSSESVVVTSSNPALLLLSTSSTATGQASISRTFQDREVFLHGLAARGVATVTLTAPGIATTTISVELVPSGFQISSHSPDRQLSAGAAEVMSLSVVALNPPTLTPANTQSLRPGVTALPTLTTSDSGVISITRVNPLTFNLAAVSPGRARVSVVQPAGFTAPARAQATDFEVNDAFFSFDPPRVAHQLRSPARLRLTPNPQTTVAVRIVSRIPDLMLVASDSGTAGSGEITVNAVNGEVPFFLDGLAASGVVRLAVSAPGYRPFEIELTLQPSGFIFAESTAVVSATSPWRVPVRPIPLSALSRQPANDRSEFRLRPGLEAITLDFDITGGTGLRLSPISLDGRTSWTPTATWTTPGTSTVTIVPPPGFLAAASSGALTAVVQ